MNDRTLANPFIQRRVATLSLFFILWATASALLWAFASFGVPALVLLLTLIGVFLWTFFGGEYWWHLPPLAFVFSGLFYYGFQIQSYEIGFVLSFLPLFLLVATGQRIEANRHRLPATIWLLLFMLTAWLVASAYLTTATGAGGAKHVLRIYVRGLWGLGFAAAFWRFGSTRTLKRLLSTMYVVVIIRSGLGILGYYFPRVLYVPFLNFVLPSVHMEGIDLRETAIILAMLALVRFSLGSEFIWKVFHGLMAMFSVVLVLLGGSRISIAVLFLVFFAYFILRKKFVTLALLLCGFGLFVAFLNTQPEFLQRQEERMTRTLSILVADAPTHDLHAGVRGSDQWHFLLIDLGIRRWTENPATFLFGRRIQPFEDMTFYTQSASLEERAGIAASVGSYEAGLWTVLGMVGLIGALCYAAFFFRAAREMLPDLWRHGIDTPERGIAFMALTMVGTWVLFCWIAGHLPSFEVVMISIALAAHRDARAPRGIAVSEGVSP
jgi:hypothetical protein